MITILGATGKVGGKIAELLIKQGEAVRVVARTADRLRAVAANKATALAGDVNDTNFLVDAFMHSEAVFTLLPPNLKSERFSDYADRVVTSICRAIELAKVKYVVNLSSIGAELAKGTGPITGLHAMEERLNKIRNINVVHLRAGYFMENQLWSVDLIKAKGINGDTTRGDVRIPMIATKDIAAIAADLLKKRDFTGISVRYLLGQRDLSMSEATEIIGGKIGKPGLSYVVFPEADAKKAMLAMGFSPDMSERFLEMHRAFNDGLITYDKRKPQNSTPTSFEAFCDEVFVPLFNRKKAA